MNILIVESAAKSRTLTSYLGEGWRVVATGGHVQTLPDNRKLHGKDAKKAFWPSPPGALPSPPWVWTDRGEESLRKIIEDAGDDASFWIATDPDREGEFIAWCLDRLLADRGPTRRITFHEVTREAVEAALEHPRTVDQRMVESALVRKFLDRLVGYRASRMANAMVPEGKASMGRVQTPTLGFVVDRELEREAHVPIPYFEVRAVAREVELKVRFHERGDEDAWRDETGKVHPSRTFDGELAAGSVRALESAGRITVTAAKSSSRQRRPDAPLSTDALLQVAGSRFGWSPRKTSALASMLYEAGHVTYIRTDSTRLASSAMTDARNVVKTAFGEDHLGPAVRDNVATGPTQDAHEAIRPTRIEVVEPAVDDADARRLYRLVRAHTLASQMAPSQRTSVHLDAKAEGLDRPLTGNVSWRTFAGWEAAYAEFMDSVTTAPPGFALEEGAVWPLGPGTDESPNPVLIEDETKPPSRYRPHTLIKAMKDAGIGRPSTYSRTVEKLEERNYVVPEDGALAPTERGRAAWLDAAPLYADDADDHDDDSDGDGTAGVTADGDGAELFSAEFTALMEERLDRIEQGQASAPETWLHWRDRIRALHEAAQRHRDAGRITAAQERMLLRLLENARESDRVAHGDLSPLSYQEARELIGRLRDGGVKPAATRKQMEYLRELVADLQLSPDELQTHTGLRDLDDIRTSDHASAALDELLRIYEERKPASAKQRRFIDDLIEQAGLTSEEAARMVDIESLDELTGGSQGSASSLIDRLQELEGAKPTKEK